MATGEFFLRESVKKRKKMEEIKVSFFSYCALIPVHISVMM